MKVLESFMIALGMKVDEKSFQRADAAFGGLTKTALQLGAVLASKLAIDKVVGDFKNAGTELNNFNKLTGIGTQKIQAFGQAITAQGGDASEALDTFKQMQALMASPKTGDVGWMGEVARFGFNHAAVTGAKDTAEALVNISAEFEHMSALDQQLAAKRLGLTDSATRFVMLGRAEVQRQLEVGGKLGIMTQKQIEDAARLTKASSEVNQVFTDIGNTIAGELTPAIAELAEDFVQFYRDNKELIDSGLESFFGTLARNIELTAAAVALMGGTSALKGLAALKALVTVGRAGAAGAGAAGAAGAAAGAGASMGLVAAGGAAALLYSTSLNAGEDQELINNKLKRGGPEAVGATVDFFVKKGWTQEQAEGIAANIQQESQFNATAIGDGGKAYGLAQWHPDRRNDFKERYKKEITKASGYEQLDFIDYELRQGKERKAGDQLRTAQTSYDAAAIVSSQYERPADKQGEIERRGEIAAGYTDNRQYHISGADTGMVKQILNEQLSRTFNQTANDFKSPEL